MLDIDLELCHEVLLVGDLRYSHPADSRDLHYVIVASEVGSGIGSPSPFVYSKLQIDPYIFLSSSSSFPHC